MEGFLNKKSIYDETYLFSGENMDTKPVNLSGRVNSDNACKKTISGSNERDP